MPWLKGLTADQSEPGESQALAFARFLCALHVPAPADAPLNYMRGVSLGQRAPSINARIRRLKERTHLITPGIEQVWNEALAAPIDVASTWLHGDLHPRNVIVHEGVITGVVDWGDLTSGDCATDLASLWMLFAQPDTRQKALQEYSDVSPATMAQKTQSSCRGTEPR